MGNEPQKKQPPPPQKDSLIYCSLNKSVYYAGDIVEGVIHIECRKEDSSHRLILRLIGEEYVQQWYSDQQQSYSQTNKKQTYLQTLVLAQFAEALPQGFHGFPFTILLPSALPSTFNQQQNSHRCYIRLIMEVELEGELKINKIEKHLNIREPYRLTASQMHIQGKQIFTNCCCCLGLSSTVLLKLSTEGQLHPGKPFNVKGEVDNTTGTTDLDGFSIELIQNFYQDYQKITYCYRKILLASYVKEIIPVGSRKQFNLNFVLPKSFGYTISGNIIYRTYVLRLSSTIDNCCFASGQRKIENTIFINSSALSNSQAQSVASPYSQSQPDFPIRANPLKSFYNLAPYISKNHLDMRNGLAQRSIRQYQPVYCLQTEIINPIYLPDKQSKTEQPRGDLSMCKINA